MFRVGDDMRRIPYRRGVRHEVFELPFFHWSAMRRPPLTTGLIGAVTLRGDLVIDSAAGGFGVLHAALRLGREFIGCDAVAPAIERFGEFAITNFPNSAAAPPVPTTGAAR
jgi:hypothetical protein